MDEQVIDLREIGQVLWDSKKTIAAVTVAFMVGSGVYLMIVPPTYQSTSLLRIKQEQGLGDSILDKIPGGSDNATKQRMNTDAEILKSRNVVEPVIKATESPNSDGEYPSYDTYIKNHVVTKPYKDTEILQLDVTGKSPAQAQKANQMMVDGFLKRLADLSRSEQQATRQFLESRVGSSKQELDDAEGKLQAYQVANQIYSTDDQIKGLTDQLSEIDKLKAANQLDLETAKAALASVNNQLGSAGASMADSPAIQQYKVQLAQLESTKASYVGKYTDENPKMKEINQQIEQARAGLDKEISNIVSNQAPSTSTVQQGLLADKFKNEAAVAVAEGKNQALAAIDAKNNATISTLPEKERGYIRVKRDADVANEIYVMLAKRLEEAKVAEVMVPNEVQVVDAATLPDKPIKPQKAMTMAIAIILGLVIGSGFSIAKALFNKKVKTADEVEQCLGLPVLGIIPDANTMKAPVEESWMQKLKRIIRRDK